MQSEAAVGSREGEPVGEVRSGQMSMIDIVRCYNSLDILYGKKRVAKLAVEQNVLRQVAVHGASFLPELSMPCVTLRSSR